MLKILKVRFGMKTITMELSKLSSLQLNQDVEQYYYVSTKLNVTDNILNNNLNKFVGFTDSQG